MSEIQILSLGDKLKPCPFCGRKMVFYRHTYVNKHNHKITEQYYMHKDYNIYHKKSCILDDINQPFVIGAGDADETTGYIGEYAQKWNERQEIIYDLGLKDAIEIVKGGGVNADITN